MSGPSPPEMARFRADAAARFGLPLPHYAALHRWSVERPAQFWPFLVEWLGLRVEGDPWGRPLLGEGVESTRFFPDLRLSYVEHLLTGPEADEVLTSYAERRPPVRLTRGALRAAVAGAGAQLEALGVGPGDAVVGVVSHTHEAIIAALGAASLGARWSSVAPDMGGPAVLQRFAPLEARILVAHGQRTYQGRRVDLQPMLERLLAGLPSVRAVVSLSPLPDTLGGRPCLPLAGAIPATQWPRFAFDHPLFVLFSSGTTGAPKAIVHGAGGTLLEHLKELRLHEELGPGAVLLFHTNAGWMMWNWQLSALAAGARIVLYEGSVTAPTEDALLRVVQAEGVTHFGTSPAYVDYLRAAEVRPRARGDFEALRRILSTGAVLHADDFDWLHAHLAPVPIHSISGGTDIVGCFIQGRPEAPVHPGYSQCVGLGLDVRAKQPQGELLEVGTGELVCVAPFPSRPVGLQGDAEGARYHAAYFAETPGAWTHGDFIELRADHHARVLGRSDGVMNIRGVRVGPAEIYAPLRAFEQVAAAAAVAQPHARSIGGSRLVLLLRLRPGVQLDRPLTLRIKRALRDAAGPYHVPAVVAAVAALPTTHSGKLSERALTDALAGRPIRNRDALRNPEALEAIVAHPALQPRG